LFGKVEAAAADRATSVVFLGTSRIEYGIVPAAFDVTMLDVPTDARR
jgi:hypothetical protein